ncbi:MAG: 60S ribosomal protein L26, partial [Nanoarchaeota archaeon]
MESMQKEWSAHWKASTQPRKQRKYRWKAPLHVLVNFVREHLSKDLRKNWKKYKLCPISNKIRPNMKNSFDKYYKNIKRKIALKNNELTLLWNCGIVQRNHANKH